MKKSRLRTPLHWITCCLSLVMFTVQAETIDDAVPLPEPLTLGAALQLSQSLHPDILLAQAEREAAEAERLQAKSRYGTEVTLLARARWVEPSPLAQQLYDSHNDSDARLEVRRRLYDFGQTRARVAAAEAASASQDHQLEQARLQRGLQVLARFLDVKLADLDFQVQDEAMAIAYVRLDRIRDRHELGQVADLELLDMENAYQQVRLARFRAQAEQRNSRARLALALNRPGELSSELVRPEFPGNGRALPELAELEAAALAGSPQLLALRAEVAAQQERVAAARAGGHPVLTGVLAASEYQRQGSSDDDYEAELALALPLSTGGQVAAQTAQARADLHRARAALVDAELRVRQEVFELLQEVAVLQAQRDEVRANMDFRDLDLDRSRALYEMEVNSDLGDAMVRFSEVRLQQARTEYELALAWAKLAVLTDNPDWNPLQGGSVNE